MCRLGAFFWFKFLNYIIGGGGEVRNINIFGGHDKIGLDLGVSSMYFRVFSYGKYTE